MSGRALRHLDGDAIAATTAELIAIDSVGGAEQQIQDHVAGWLGEAGLDVRRWTTPVDDLARHPRYSAEVERRAVAGVAATLGEGEGRTLLLNAHVDVVPAADQPGWTSDPFAPVVGAGRVIGRGAADTKGGLAAAMHALAALARARRDGLVISGRVVLTPVAGEEDGGCGTLATLVDGPLADDRPDGAIVLEPTELGIAPAAAGALTFRVDVPGRTAHGSVRTRGVSAIEKGIAVHRAILDLETERNVRWRHDLLDHLELPLPICVGRIEGGDHRCDEAAWLRLEGRLGVAPHEPVDAARAELAGRVAEVAAADPWLTEHPPQVSWVGGQWLPGQTPDDDDLVRAVRAAAPTSPVRAVTYGCDVGLLRDVGGIPGVVYGPGDIAAAHAPDEQVAVADLLEAARTLVRTAVGFCGTAPH